MPTLARARRVRLPDHPVDLDAVIAAHWAALIPTATPSRPSPPGGRDWGWTVSLRRERNEAPGGFGINGFIPGAGKCVAFHCGAPCGQGALMCRAHWGSVPTGLRQNLAYVMGLWRNDGDTNLEEVRIAQWACVESLDDGGTP